MYRLFIYIFSIFILSLTTIPCSDNMIAVDRDIMNNTMDHNSASEHSDNCSPFCACNCCKTTVNFSLKNIDLQELVVDSRLVESYPFYEENLFFKEPLDIWQPPKLS